MTCILKLHEKNYMVKNNEFEILKDAYFYPLTPIPDLSDLDRELLFLKKLNFFSNNLVIIGFSHGGYIAFNSANFFDNVDICFYNNTEMDKYIFSTNLLSCDVNISNKICISEINKNFPLSILYNIHQVEMNISENQFLVILGGITNNINYIHLSFLEKMYMLEKISFPHLRNYLELIIIIFYMIG